ncbi:MAG: sodium:calcium antiporter, partial [Oscillospiraceae bacterium]|nr:sodium:calcium antiporter [Oscillospiraceae bacterium]
MWIPVLLLLVGLVLLIKGGDWFVDGASGIARRFYLPEILIGATVVSIGTTLPEVMVSVDAAMMGSGSIAYGNALGSIICNTALIAALTIAIRPNSAARKSLVLPVSFFFAAFAVYGFAAYVLGTFSRVVGIVLLGLFVVYMVVIVLRMKKDGSIGGEGLTEEALEAKSGEDYTVESEEKGTKDKLWKDILFLVIGAAFIALGANLLVDNAIVV